MKCELCLVRGYSTSFVVSLSQRNVFITFNLLKRNADLSGVVIFVDVTY